MATVMVVSTDPVIAALLGTMVELEEHTAVFPAGGERTTAAVARQRPDLILLDCDHEAAASAKFVDEARSFGSGIVLFSPGRAGDEVRERAEQWNVPWFSLPIDRAT